MEGPTPVSALIHAATMVTAGVYMVARCQSSTRWRRPRCSSIAVVGAALTALFAATIALVQNDIKRVLAYSTISQLGYMFLGVGVADSGPGIFHLMTHAFFKALLFLGAGSVIHALLTSRTCGRWAGSRPSSRHHRHDARRHAGHRRHPAAGGLLQQGRDPVGGLGRRDEESLGDRVRRGAVLTALYMFRLLYLTFYGAPRDRRLYDHAHEPPATMRIPLIILAVLAAVGGWIGIPHAIGNPLGHVPNLLHEWLEPVFADAEPLRAAAAAETAHLAEEYGLMAASVAVALLGIGLATYFYRKRPELAARAAAAFPVLYRLMVHKYYVDEIYGALVVRPYFALCAFCWRVVDEILIDGFVVKAWVVRWPSTAVPWHACRPGSSRVTRRRFSWGS